jgi:hypothetical protein
VTRRPLARQLSTKQAGEIVGRSDWWVRERIREGAIKASNIATRPGECVWRVDEDDLRAYLADRQYDVRPMRAVRGRAS